MNTTASSDWAKKQAHAILDEFTPLPEWEYDKRHEILVKNLLAAAKVPEGCVRDEHGKDWDRGTYATNYVMACVERLGAEPRPLNFDAVLAAREGKCTECGIYPPDYPSKTCCGCDAYREHQR